MDSTNLIGEGLTLMVFGMGFVFVFLTLLVFVTSLMSRLVTRYLPEAAPAPARARAPAKPAPDTDQDQLIAVIGAAIHQYRSRHKK